MSHSGRRRGIGLGAGALALAVAGMAGVAGIAQAAPAGTLDPSYGFGGAATAAIPGSGLVNDGVAQSDGKVVVAGFAQGATGNDFMVARFDEDGDLDSAFGGGDGIATTDVGSFNDIVEAVEIQSDGKIVVAGHSSNDRFAVVRYNADGTLDTAFDGDGGAGNGIVTTTIVGEDEGALTLAVSSDRIVVGGYTDTDASADYDYDFALVRYNRTDGTLDTSFDGDTGPGNGKVVTDIVSGGLEDFLEDVEIQSDKIVAAGFANTDTSDPLSTVNHDVVVAQYSGSDGRLDTGFGGGDGIAITPIGSGEDTAIAAAIQGDGKIVTAGYSEVGAGDRDFALVRFGTAGGLDETFDGDGGSGNGKITIPTAPGSRQDQAQDVAIDASGRIVVAGTAILDTPEFDSAVAIARLTSATGALDDSFDGDGMALEELSTGTDETGDPLSDFAQGMTLTSDRIFVAGRAGGDAMAARFLGEPVPFVSIDDATVTEGDAGTTDAVFTVTLDEAPAGTVTVDYETADADATAPADYTATSGTLQFTPSDLTEEVVVSVAGDTAIEGNELFHVRLSNASAGLLVDDGESAGLIENDDEDTVAPETTIDKAPKKKTSRTKAKFRFSADEAGSTFECKLDRKPFKRCGSPKKYKRLDPGKHKFKVRATDPAGNLDGTAAKHKWKVIEG